MHHATTPQTRRFVFLFLRSIFGLVLLLTTISGQSLQVRAHDKTSGSARWKEEIAYGRTKQYPGEKIALPGDWDESKVMKPTVLKDATGYKMWYDGVNRFENTRIGLAYSSDGTTWLKSLENPVLSGGPEAWDTLGEHGPFVLQDSSEYKMWYEGSNGTVRQLGYAASPDGVHWTKYAGNPVLQAGPEGYDQDVAGHGSVLFEGGVYKLWYHAIGDQGILIAHATSTDGIAWTKQGPVFKPEAGGWDQDATWGPSVLRVDNTYWMWYTASGPSHPTAIGVATSTDGLAWTRMLEGPVDLGNNENVGDPHVIQDGGILKMWYQTWSQDYQEAAIYYAESDDGIHWVNVGDNPVLRTGSFRVILPSIQKQITRLVRK